MCVCSLSVNDMISASLGYCGDCHVVSETSFKAIPKNILSSGDLEMGEVHTQNRGIREAQCGIEKYIVHRCTEKSLHINVFNTFSFSMIVQSTF